MLEIGALKIFHRVGKLSGIGAAARDLRITQSAVSQRLAKLERRLGRALHGKAGRRMVLTEDGRRLYAACCRAFDVLDAAEAALTGAEPKLLGAVRVCALSEVGKALILPALCRFRTKHPGVSFDIRYRLPYEMLGYLYRNEADFVVTNELYRRPQMEAVPVYREDIVCVGPRPARRLSWRDMVSARWMAYGEEDPLWQELERSAARHGVELPQPMLRIADVESILRLAADGVGYALAPRHALQIRALPGVATHRLPLPRITRQIYLCRLKTLPMSQAAQAFWDYLLKTSASG